MPEKIISIRLNDEEITKLNILRNILIKNHCIEYNTSQLFKYFLNRTFSEIVPDEIQQNNR